ncbi:MAG: imidazole glycerol phosphate synthase subunit HisH, partial [Pseudomonadales bacterium]
ELAERLRDGGPWGQGFPEPLFDGEFRVLGQRIVGRRHLRLRLEAGRGRADRIIFPGVGQAGSAMATLIRTGLADALRQRLGEGVPVLGICLGLQISLDHSEEGDTPTLSLVAGETRRFHFADPTLKVPHMGWNTLSLRQPHPVLKDLHEDDAFYFVHSYYTVPKDPAVVLAEATYEQPFCCALGKDNYVGVQFHTEKSGRAGLALRARFAAWDGVFKGAAGEASRAH